MNYQRACHRLINLYQRSIVNHRGTDTLALLTINNLYQERVIEEHRMRIIAYDLAKRDLID